MPNAHLLLITPPFIQFNTPYPATANLKGFLDEKGYCVEHSDLSIECIAEILSSRGLENLFECARRSNISANSQRIIKAKEEYIKHIDSAIAFLKGKYPAFAYRIVNGALPKASRFNLQQNVSKHFGSDGVFDKAKLLATLFLEDIGDFITECVDNRFGFSRYAEQIGINASNFDSILNELKQNTPLTRMMLHKLDEAVSLHNPRVIGFTIPFPGNLLMALKCAQHIRSQYSHISIVIGGGYVSTELRNLCEPRLFDLVHYVCLDDGELPLLKLLNHITKGETELARTFRLENGRVTFVNNTTDNDFDHSQVGTPSFVGLPLGKYIPVCETTNPMHNLWSSDQWNKMVLAHGCYWHKCAFCDTTLDYIKRYSSADAALLCDRIESIVAQTGRRGFHFVDEAASPALLRKLAEELIRRNLRITWWTNIRFEKAFTRELCQLIAQSGCIAVSGGIEVASDRLLQLMSKGVSIEQLATTAKALRSAGIMIHAYLMYGFPTQTAKETIDSLEIVRQLFQHKLIQSAFWHRFTLTVHSPIGQSPSQFGITPIPLSQNAFTQNGMLHNDPQGANHEMFARGLVTALYNFMHSNGINYDLQTWFDFKIPKTSVHPNHIGQFIKR